MMVVMAALALAAAQVDAAGATSGDTNVYTDGRVMPAGQFEFARHRGERSLSGSVRYYDEEGGEQGTGFQRITAGNGAPLRDAFGRKRDIDKGPEHRGGLQTPWLGGTLNLNTSINLTGTDQGERHITSHLAACVSFSTDASAC